jgi:hypothetical protein
VLDSQRRDFTINAMYYTSVTFGHLKEQEGTRSLPAGKAGNKKEQEELPSISKSLEKQGITYDADNHLLIIQSPELISQSFPQGVPDLTYLFALVKSLSPDVQPRQLGILIDPAQ